MTEVQERIMELVDEIDKVCQERNLTYILAKQTARYAATEGKFINKTYMFYLMMPLSDIFVLKQMAENNPDLEEFSFRYVDTQSVLIDGTRAIYHQYPGISVTILPLREKLPSKQVLGSERYLNNRNMANAIEFFSAFPPKSARVCLYKLRGRKFCEDKLKKSGVQQGMVAYQGSHYGVLRNIFMGHKKLAAWVQQENIKASASGKQGDFLWYMIPNGELIKFKRADIQNGKRIAFEGRELPVAKDVNAYLKKLYGTKWKSKSEQCMPSTADIRVIQDCYIPFKEYMELIEGRGTSLKKLAKYRKSYNIWMVRKYHPMEKKVEHTFRQIKGSVERIDIWYNYQKKREILKKSFEQGDIKKLEKEMKTYLNVTDKCFSDQVGFYIDEELFTYATAVWESKGKPEYAKKVYALVPELYKQEDVETYLKKRGRI
jgi:hypothetical protein